MRILCKFTMSRW